MNYDATTTAPPVTGPAVVFKGETFNVSLVEVYKGFERNGVAFPPGCFKIKKFKLPVPNAPSVTHTFNLVEKQSGKYTRIVIPVVRILLI